MGTAPRSAIVLAGLWVTGWAAPAAASIFSGSWPVAAVARRVGPSVVGVINESRVDGLLRARGSGSGVVYSADGVIVTNEHVVRGASALRVLLPGGRGLPARLLGSDPYTDLAVLKVRARHLVPATFASGRLEVGELAVAIGNPMGVGFAGTVTVGVISGLDRQLGLGYAPWALRLIQTDAAINPGNSGGALANASGEVVGIPSVKIVTPGFEGMGFAIPAETVRQVADAIVLHGEVIRPWLGVGVVEVLPPDPDGSPRLLVRSVVLGSPAARSGVRPGDVIVRLAGAVIHGRSDLIRALMRLRVGQRVRLEVRRSCASVPVEVTLGRLAPERAA